MHSKSEKIFLHVLLCKCGLMLPGYGFLLVSLFKEKIYCCHTEVCAPVSLSSMEIIYFVVI